MQRRFGREPSETMMDDSVLAVYVEPLLADRRVLFVGDARTDALTRVTSVADRVLALDTSGEGVVGRLPNGAVEPFDARDLEALDLPFDAVLVTDVRALRGAFEECLDDFARVLGRRGRLVLCAPDAPDSIDYEDLWDRLAIRFDVVRMAGAAPMHGLAIAELGEGEAPSVVVDGRLVTKPPRTEAFVAVCSQVDVALEGYVVVQTDAPRAARPAGDEAGEGARRERTSTLEKRLAAIGAELEETRTQVAATRTERDAFRDDRKRLERELREARDGLTKSQRALASLEDAARSAPSAEDFRQLEELLEERADRLQELEAEVERRGRMVRELVEETRGGAALAQVADPIELDRALERALRAEAERAEAVFLVDELRSRIADSTDAGVEALRQREAELAGRTRGLRARLAEAEQQIGELQSALTKSRVEAPHENRLGALVASEAGLSTQVGQLGAQLMMSRERELESRAARDLARGENLALVAQVAALETQHRELRDRIVGELDRIARRTGESGSVDTALLGVESEVGRLQGECTGLRMRLASFESSAKSPTEPLPEKTAVVGAGVDTSEIDALRLENQALTADLAEAKAAARKASDVSLATRDALVERLQLELADHERRSAETIERERTATAEVTRLREALVEAAASVESTESLTRRVASLERDLRDAIGAAERAAADARAHASKAEDLESSQRGDLDALTRRATTAEAALSETRGILEDLRNTASAAIPPAGRRSTDIEAEEQERSTSTDAEKDLLLRSLGAQLEERDDRIRALERRLSGTSPDVVGDEEALRREILDLRERSVRLADELRVERDARRAAEERPAPGAAMASSVSGRELERRAEQHAKQLEEALVRVEATERDVRALRDVFTETRTGLEQLFGVASGGGDPELATRIGELLTLLGRY